MEKLTGAQAIGANIARLRKEKGMTQDRLGELLGVSAQAVSKWEHSLSSPDLSLLPKIAEIFDVTIDQLFSEIDKPETEYVPPEKRKDINKMLLRIVVDSAKGDKVRVNLPLALINILKNTKTGSMSIGGMNLNGFDASSVDWDQVLMMVEQGIIGKLVEVESAEGDNVAIFVE